ncbi:39S ribosomal protein L12, mitochondrial [Venturia canescens]|uniref:39S ribosomal protein L12, mitochondrial n=1 Tax=Venturia canescens TaxID=32260 RepID=UPI001C9CB224|nr:39S ribosomal protein L12, mitochondrial [Venturia canescens]
MMNTLRLVARQNVHQLRKFHKCVTYCQTEAAVAGEKLSIPVPEGVDKPVSPKIDKLANDISSLNLIEVAELSDLLKKRLNLPDAPVMPMGGFVAAKPQDADEDAAPQIVKTSFTVKLVKFDEKQKVALIKEIKNLIPGTNLVQAKKFVESVPVVVKSDIPKDESEQLKEAITKVGGEVEIS